MIHLGICTCPCQPASDIPPFPPPEGDRPDTGTNSLSAPFFSLLDVIKNFRTLPSSNWRRKSTIKLSLNPYPVHTSHNCSSNLGYKSNKLPASYGAFHWVHISHSISTCNTPTHSSSYSVSTSNSTTNSSSNTSHESTTYGCTHCPSYPLYTTRYCSTNKGHKSTNDLPATYRASHYVHSSSYSSHGSTNDVSTAYGSTYCSSYPVCADNNWFV